MRTSRSAASLLASLLLASAAAHPTWVSAPSADESAVVQVAVAPPAQVPAGIRGLPDRASRLRPPTAEPTSPSGQVMPRGHLPTWHQVMAADFTGRSLPRGWTAYHGKPGGNPHGRWDASRVSTRAGVLRLDGAWHGGRFTTGGLMARSARTTYGKYEVRFRVQRGRGVSYALLLWPTDGRWPMSGEIDFAEDGGGNRTATTGTLHYGARNSITQRHVRADFSTWQTVGVEWTPGLVVYTLNGRPWGSVRSSAVPSGSMDLAIQVEAGRGTRWSPAPSAATPARVALEVDWAVAYKRR